METDVCLIFLFNHICQTDEAISQIMIFDYFWNCADV